jgi:putative ABC transport system substrate-binding protein
MRQKTAVVLILTVALLTTLWTGESWGQAKIPRVGILSFGWGATDDVIRQRLEPFRRSLAEHGWIEGKNVSFEYRSAPSDPSQLAEFAAELVRLKVDVIFAINAPGVRGAYGATFTIPIVAFDFTSDPVAEGYIESYGRPGGNITGVFLHAPGFAGKWLDLLKAIVPSLSRVVVLWDPGPGSMPWCAVDAVAASCR